MASWAARFLFSGEQLNQPVGRLSGGERARVLIAQLMLQPADMLLLDEPTNDLDIPTLEILEESLLEFRGSLVLVTHDRYMLDRVSTIVLGLDGDGNAETFADYSQWEARQAERKQPAKATARMAPHASADATQSKDKPKKLSYLEAREYSGIEQRIAKAESYNSDFSVPEQPVGVPPTFREYAELMFDLQALAFQGTSDAEPRLSRHVVRVLRRGERESEE